MIIIIIIIIIIKINFKCRIGITNTWRIEYSIGCRPAVKSYIYYFLKINNCSTCPHQNGLQLQYNYNYGLKNINYTPYSYVTYWGIYNIDNT